MQFRWRRLLFRLALIPVVLVTLSLITVLLCERQVKSAIISSLNNHLDAEVRVNPDNIDLTILRTFPMASLQFRDVLMLEAIKRAKRDTLFFVRRLNLHFNLADLWSGDYTIRKLSVNGAVVNLITARDGTPNYIFWKKSVDNSSQLSIRLDNVYLSEVKARIIDRKNSWRTSIQVATARLRGAFGASDFQLDCGAEMAIHYLDAEGRRWLNDKRINIASSMDVQDDKYSFRKTQLAINDLKIALEGGFRLGDGLEQADVKFKTPELNVASLLSLLPDDHKKRMAGYSGSGDLRLEGSIAYLKGKGLSSSTKFAASNASVVYKANGATAGNIFFNGHLVTRADASQLSVTGISADLPGGKLRGSLQAVDLSDPTIDASLQCDADLSRLAAFWPVDTLQSISGRASVNIIARGKLAEFRRNTLSSGISLRISATANEVSVRFKKDEANWNIPQASITVSDRHVEVQTLKLVRGNTDVEIAGAAPGLLDYLTDHSQPLKIRGTLKSGNFTLDDFWRNVNGRSTASATGLLPGNVELYMDVALGAFSFGKFQAQAVSGNMEMRNRKLWLGDVRFNCMQGAATVDALVDNSRAGIDLDISADVSRINIRDLFSQLNNFGQSTLTDRHIKGFATAKIQFKGSWNNALEPDLSGISSVCDLSVQQGELAGFSPLLSLARFVDVKELSSVRFRDLHTTVSIHDRSVFIPPTVIKNSAMDIDVWGRHGFDNSIDYHFKLLLSDLLAGRRKRSGNEFAELEHDDENRRSLFVLMTGTVDNPQMKFDRKAFAQRVEENVHREKENIKSAFREEMKLFRHDELRDDNGSTPVKRSDSAPKKSLTLPARPVEDDF